MWFWWGHAGSYDQAAAAAPPKPTCLHTGAFNGRHEVVKWRSGAPLAPPAMLIKPRLDLDEYTPVRRGACFCCAFALGSFSCLRGFLSKEPEEEDGGRRRKEEKKREEEGGGEERREKGGVLLW